jgi:hypothetical protein
MNKTILVTNSMLLEKLETLEELLKAVIERQAINTLEEVSLTRATKILKVGEKTVIQYIEEGELQARKVKSNKSTSGYSYRIRLSAIKEFQENSNYVRKSVPFNPKEFLKELYK